VQSKSWPERRVGAKTRCGAGELEREPLAVDGSLFIGNPPPGSCRHRDCPRSSAEASPSLAPPRSPKSEGSRPLFQTTCHSVLLRPTSSQSNCPYNWISLQSRCIDRLEVFVFTIARNPLAFEPSLSIGSPNNAMFGWLSICQLPARLISQRLAPGVIGYILTSPAPVFKWDC
jgi:hypothetical protein